MTKMKVGFLHPGAMGISLAASAQNTGHTAYWVSEGRSRQTQERAARFDLVDARTLEKLCETCAVMVSVCPPHAAEEVASQVLACSFEGLYLDANAISPQRAMRIGQLMGEAGGGVRRWGHHWWTCVGTREDVAVPYPPGRADRRLDVGPGRRYWNAGGFVHRDVGCPIPFESQPNIDRAPVTCW